MQIPSLFSVVPAIVNSGLNLLGVDVSGGITKAKIEEAAAQTPLQDALTNVDLTSITPDDFSSLIEGLRKAGQLPAEGYETLKALRLELDLQRVPHDRPVDLPAMLRAKLDGQSLAGEAQREVTEQTRRQLQWLETIATRNGIDTLA